MTYFIFVYIWNIEYRSMNLLVMPWDMQCLIYYYSINYDGMVNITRSIRRLMLTCSSIHKLLHSELSRYFWNQLSEKLCWTNTVEWNNFVPSKFICMRQLQHNEVSLSS